MALPRRYITALDQAARRPVHVVWELTLACDLKCSHCGSRAGHRRRDELTTRECLDLVRQIAALGTRHVTLIGGEAYLRKDWLQIVEAIRNQGMDCTIQTGGRGLTPERIDAAACAGLQGIGVSIDGMPAVHDRLRGIKGSFDAALAALIYARARNLKISANTQITRLVLPELRSVFEQLVAVGVEHWQVQLTVAMGRAADNPELLLQPYQLLELMPLLAELYVEGVGRGLLLQPGNNVGYFGPYESLWRGSGDEEIYWRGCNAGVTSLGIEADGTIKGCPSLPTASYAGGNIRDVPLDKIWASSPQVGFRGRPAELWGFCRSCYYAKVCEGGCNWTSHSLFGRPGNNPYCHHRALELQRRGMRERVEQVERAPGESFDHGHFVLIEELAAAAAVRQAAAVDEVAKQQPEATGNARTRGLTPCRGCRRHVFFGTVCCPHCGGDVAALEVEYTRNIERARHAYARLATLLDK